MLGSWFYGLQTSDNSKKSNKQQKASPRYFISSFVIPQLAYMCPCITLFFKLIIFLVLSDVFSRSAFCHTMNLLIMQLLLKLNLSIQQRNGDVNMDFEPLSFCSLLWPQWKCWTWRVELWLWCLMVQQCFTQAETNYMGTWKCDPLEVILELQDKYSGCFLMKNSCL